MALNTDFICEILLSSFQLSFDSNLGNLFQDSNKAVIVKTGQHTTSAIIFQYKTLASIMAQMSGERFG